MNIFIFIVGLIIVAAAAFYGGYLYRSVKSSGYMSDIVDFHTKFKLTYDGPPRVLSTELFNFRSKFQQEEQDEYIVEQNNIDLLMLDPNWDLKNMGKIDQCLEKQLDALVDLVYVVLGTAYLQFGADVFNEAWDRVHGKNMQKVRALRAGDSKRGSTYDVIKPAGWTPPCHLDLIQERHRVLELTHPMRTFEDIDRG